METMYYGDKECEVLSEYGDKVVIRLDIGYCEFSSDDYYDPNFSESVDAEIIVNKKHIYKKPLRIPDIINESETMLAKIKTEKKNAENEIFSTKRKASKEIEELKRNIQKFEGLETFYNYLDGTIKYVVYLDSYNKGIDEIDNIMCNCDNEDLAAISFRRKGRVGRDNPEGVRMYIQQYSDGSGGKHLVKGFKELSEAKEYFVSLIKNKKRDINSSILDTCAKYGLIIDEVEKHKSEQKEKEEKEKKKELEKLNAKIKELTNEN